MLIQTECPTGSIRHRATPQRNVPPICDSASLDTTNLKGFMTSYSEDREIYGAMEETKYLYKVVSGAVRTCRTFKDGRRQIGAFYVPGDVFGIETGDRHTLSAETSAPSKLLLINRSTLAALAARDNAIASQLWMVTALELRKVQDHVLSFAKPARERVAGFIVEMARRLSVNEEVQLPMKRQDIADYLGLTIETVSRSLTSLENIAAVKIQKRRQIVLRNYPALVRLSA
jgi:CRP/FNR family nitrogen fixation transcriptional regulator